MNFHVSTIDFRGIHWIHELPLDVTLEGLSFCFATMNSKYRFAHRSRKQNALFNDFAHTGRWAPRLFPKPHKERNSFRNCWWRVRGIFQGYVGEILELLKKLKESNNITPTPLSNHESWSWSVTNLPGMLLLVRILHAKRRCGWIEDEGEEWSLT